MTLAAGLLESGPFIAAIERAWRQRLAERRT
jgi:hypothetical protein